MSWGDLTWLDIELGERVAQAADGEQTWGAEGWYWWLTRTPENAPELFSGSGVVAYESGSAT